MIDREKTTGGGTFHISMLIFPDMAQLDFAGPYEVFSRLPGCEVTVLAPNSEPVAVAGGLRFQAHGTIDAALPCDLIFVPGGSGVNPLLEDRPVLEFLRSQATQARYLTSVCTGALLLGAAGLLRGYRATTHWLSLDLLPFFGAIPEPARVVIDRDRITGAGVTACIDFGLIVAAELFGEVIAKSIQLMLEYHPAPPFACGHPDQADPDIVAGLRQRRAASQAARLDLVQRAARLYGDRTAG